MSENIYDVKKEIGKVKEKIYNQNKYIKSKDERLEDIKNIINKFASMDDYITDYNSSLNHLRDAISSSIVSSGKFDNADALSYKIEKDCYRDDKLSCALTSLESEKQDILTSTSSASNEIKNLNYELERLKRKERELLLATI